MKRTLSAAALVALLAGPVSAQVAWEAPALVSPAVPSGFSIFLWGPAGGDLGVLGSFRHAAGPVGLGWRVGLAEQSGPGGDLTVSGGVDASGFLARAVEGSEVDVIWWGGGGISVGDEWMISGPLGLILGWSGSGDSVIFSPYGGAHVVLDIWSGPGDSTNLDAVVDLGIDLVFSSGWIIRGGFTLGSDRESVAVGFKIPS